MEKIDTGYEGKNIPEDFEIPSNGIEDVDRAVFDLFDKKLSFEVNSRDKTIRVPVVFASGERFALTRRKNALRDDNNALILPVISIVRRGIDQSPGLGGYGTPIAAREQENYVIKRRLDKSDREYQNIINKLRIKNQDSTASRSHFNKSDIAPGNEARPGKVASRRNMGNLSLNAIDTGKLFDENLTNNIFEIITIPYPEFFIVDYDITFWTQYMSESNQMIEHMMASYDGQNLGFQIFTKAGYEHFAFVMSSIGADNNLTEYSNDERLIRNTFNIKVPSYLIAPKLNSLSSPFRTFLSAPTINFEISEVKTESIKKEKGINTKSNINKFMLSDIDLLNNEGNKPLSEGQDGTELLHIESDPFTGKKIKKYFRVLSKNQRKGETVFSSKSAIIIDDQTD